MADAGKHVDELLKLYLKEIPATSETAKAITQGAALAAISQTAEKEGLHYIATAIFMSEEERFLKADQPDMANVIAERVQEFRKHLPDSCETARAIDRNARWSEISQSAERDGLHEMAGLILEAEQEGLKD